MYVSIYQLFIKFKYIILKDMPYTLEAFKLKIHDNIHDTF